MRQEHPKRKKKGKVKKMLGPSLQRPLLQPGGSAEDVRPDHEDGRRHRGDVLPRSSPPTCWSKSMEKNLGTLQKHLDEVIAKRLS